MVTARQIRICGLPDEKPVRKQWDDDDDDDNNGCPIRSLLRSWWRSVAFTSVRIIIFSYIMCTLNVFVCEYTLHCIIVRACLVMGQ